MSLASKSNDSDEMRPEYDLRGGVRGKYYKQYMKREAINPGDRVKDVHFTEATMAVDLFDGRTITVPLVRYPKLLDATPQPRQNWQISAAGYGLHWPDIDEDLSTAGLLRGAPAAAKPVPARA